MDEKLIIKLSRRIEYLVHKRHRSLRHIQKALSDEGCFWMNSVRLNRQSVLKFVNSQYGPLDFKLKTERFYYLGFSLGKIVDLGNAVNTIYTLLQLFEEYETYIRHGPPSLEQNALLRHILPQCIDTFAKQQLTQDKKYAQYEEYVSSLNQNSSDLFGGSDFIETVRKPGVDVISPNQFRDPKSLAIQNRDPNIHHHEEVKGESKASLLPVQEQRFNSYDDYIMKSSTLSSQLGLSSHASGTELAAMGRVHASKVDPKAPSFKVLSCHSISIKLNYCEVAQLLIDMLILTYNKMYDNQFLNQQMLQQVEKIDNIIVVSNKDLILYQNKVIKSLCEDINRVARQVAIKQLSKINKALKMEHNLKAKQELRKVPSDDDLFEIAALDLDGNNKPDNLLLNSVAAAGNAMGNSMRTSSERVGHDINTQR